MRRSDWWKRNMSVCARAARAQQEIAAWATSASRLWQSALAPWCTRKDASKSMSRARWPARPHLPETRLWSAAMATCVTWTAPWNCLSKVQDCYYPEVHSEDSILCFSCKDAQKFHLLILVFKLSTFVKCKNDQVGVLLLDLRIIENKKRYIWNIVHSSASVSVERAAPSAVKLSLCEIHCSGWLLLVGVMPLCGHTTGNIWNRNEGDTVGKPKGGFEYYLVTVRLPTLSLRRLSELAD